MSRNVEKPLIIHGPLNSLRDVLKIATTEGRKALRTQEVNVKPLVMPYGSTNYLVVVENNGCERASSCGKQGKKE